MASPSMHPLVLPWRRPGSFRYALSRLRGIASPPVTVTEPADDIVSDRDAEIATRDGTILRANVFRPPDNRAYPVVLCAHPYGKDKVPRRRSNTPTSSRHYPLLPQ